MKRSLRSWLWRVPLDREVDEEIAFHIEMRTRELVEQGIDGKAAREIVLARLGDVRRLKRTCVDLGRKRDRDLRLTQWLGELGDDVRFALRQLKAAPGFTVVATITLALGIGANSAMFAVADATLIRPLPFADPERLVMVWEQQTSSSRVPVNPLDLLDWTERNHTFDALAGITGSGGAMTGRDGTAEGVAIHAVTVRFFDVLGVKPVAGRTFLPSDDRSGSNVVVMSEGFWLRRFGGDRSLVGGQITLDGQPVTVIGIVPEAFQFDLPNTGTPGRIAMWRLMRLDQPRTTLNRFAHFLQVVGRVKRGVTVETAQTDMTAVADAIAREFPTTNTGHGINVVPLREGLIRQELRLTTILLFGVIGFVLLMCCVNMASLLLVRTSARARELAVRSALGAGRRRIVRQMLTESFVLAAVGGLVGLGIGWALLQAAPSLIPAGLIPGTVQLTFDRRVVVFCAVTSCLVAMAFGLAPAWQATGRSLVETFALDGRAATPRGTRLRQVLAAVEIAAAVLLLCGAGLLIRTFLALGSVDPGHRAHEVLSMTMGISRSEALNGAPGSWLRFYESIEREVAKLPGVEQVGWGSALPLAGGWYTQPFQIVGDPPRPIAAWDATGYQIVSASYFPTLDVPVLSGRGFTSADRASAPTVCIVDDAFVRRFLNGRQAVGTRLEVQAMAQPRATVIREIVGVVAQIKERPDERESEPHIYVPLAQSPWWSATLVVRPKDGPAAVLAPAVRVAIARIDKDRPTGAPRTLDSIAREATARPRFRAVLVGACAGLAMALAAVGIFGVLAYGVQRRSREIGVRIALGARRSAIVRLIVGEAVRISAAGAITGLALAFILSQSVAGFLFGVAPRDPMTFGLVTLVLGVVATLASVAPAVRAMRVDPLVAFRSE